MTDTPSGSPGLLGFSPENLQLFFPYPADLFPEWSDEQLTQDIVTNTHAVEGARMIRDGAALLAECGRETGASSSTLTYAILKNDAAHSLHIYERLLDGLRTLADQRKAFRAGQDWTDGHSTGGQDDGIETEARDRGVGAAGEGDGQAGGDRRARGEHRADEARWVGDEDQAQQKAPGSGTA